VYAESPNVGIGITVLASCGVSTIYSSGSVMLVLAVDVWESKNGRHNYRRQGPCNLARIRLHA